MCWLSTAPAGFRHQLHSVHMPTRKLVCVEENQNDDAPVPQMAAEDLHQSVWTKCNRAN